MIQELEMKKNSDDTVKFLLPRSLVYDGRPALRWSTETLIFDKQTS